MGSEKQIIKKTNTEAVAVAEDQEETDQMILVEGEGNHQGRSAYLGEEAALAYPSA